MSSTRKTALVAGIFYLITFISIPTLALYGQIKDHRDWILSSGGHTGVLVGCFLEVIVALAGIGTAVTLYPVVKRQNEGCRAGLRRLPHPGSRHDLHRRRQPPFAGDLPSTGGATGAAAASLVTTGASHVATYNGTFLLGQTLMPAINALLLGSLLYRSRLVPRALPVMGLIGAPLLLTAVVAILFGGIEQISVWTALATLPVAAWEFSLGVWLVVKGFRPSPVTAGMAADRPPPAYQDAAV